MNTTQLKPISQDIPEVIQAKILRLLARIEQDKQVKILYACESGSRAWGFSSPDSDYDVRFIYTHPQDWYLSFDVERRRDVIECPIQDEIDCNGWDIKKAMHLLTRSNGALLEWLSSPIVYQRVGRAATQLLELGKFAVNPTALCYHYSHMARANAKDYLFNEEQVKLKKYLYVLRPLLAIRYLEAYRTNPPVPFAELVDLMAPRSLLEPINVLLYRKSQSPELGFGPPIYPLNRFILAELERHGTRFKGMDRPDMIDSTEVKRKLNQIFRQAIQEDASYVEAA